MVILGDLNLDYLETTLDSHKLLASIEEEFTLKQIIQTCTRIHRHGSTLIDVILTNVKNIYASGCINYNVSDHLPICDPPHQNQSEVANDQNGVFSCV